MPSRPKFAMYWASACGGCEIAVLNDAANIQAVDEHFEVAFWPAVMDAKIKDLEALPDGDITLTLFNGGIRNSENEHMARLLRQKSRLLVAFGSCANEGCIPGLANLSSRQALLDTAFSGLTTSNPQAIRPQSQWNAPEGSLALPEIQPLVRTLDQVVDVDYHIPGCPPETRQITAVLMLVVQALAGQAELPPTGSVLGAGTSTVCDECPRMRSEKHITRFTRIHLVEKVNPNQCLLEQGIPCNGLATRSGCGALCPQAGAQCIGCYGPADGVYDFGARLITSFGSVIESQEPKEIERILDGLPDPAGQVYRFNLARSFLKGGKTALTEGN